MKKNNQQHLKQSKLVVKKQKLAKRYKRELKKLQQNLLSQTILKKKKYKNYSDSERYKTTDLTPGSTIVENVNTDEGKEKDGFKFDTLNPSAGSPDKKAYGYEIVIDKKTGQRTYTKIAVTDSGRIPATGGDKPFLGEGEKLTPESPTVTYKPGEDGYTKKAGKHHTAMKLAKKP